jgi:glycosyltransferase involved in cell wall biosynthesis
MQIAYVTSRFLLVSETFILRELDAVAAQGLDITVIALFPTPRGPSHDGAARWESRTRRARPSEVAHSLAWWAVRSPRRLAGTFAEVAMGHGRSPGLLVRALVTAAIASHHARWAAGRGIRRVHAHYATYGALCAWVVKRLAGVPYTFTAHAHDLYVDQHFLAQKVAGADAVIAVSEYNRRFLADYGGDAVTPVVVVRCGIDVDSYPFRERTVPAEGEVRGLCVASLQDYKGHRVLLDALAGDPGGLGRISFTFAGSGPLADDLRRRADRLGLDGRVTFAGAMSEQDVRAALDRADLFVLPSIVAPSGQMEGLPVALMEAMASGVPVVSTRVSGIPELVRDGETGLLAEPGDPPGLARAMRDVLDAPDRARERAVAARRLVEREFDLGATGEAVAAILQGSVERA